MRFGGLQLPASPPFHPDPKDSQSPPSPSLTLSLTLPSHKSVLTANLPDAAHTQTHTHMHRAKTYMTDSGYDVSVREGLIASAPPACLNRIAQRTGEEKGARTGEED